MGIGLSLEISMIYIFRFLNSWIKLASDCPSQNPCVKDNQIRFKFFKKPVFNPLLISKDSAKPFKTKRAALSSEALRRLRNTSRELPWVEKAEILSEFSHKLMCSGWDKKSSYEFIMAGLTGYHRQLERADAGIFPLYHPREWD